MKSFTIKDKEKINEMREYLFNSNPRDYLLFIIGINTGIKLQSLLLLRFEDLIENNKIVDKLTFHKMDFFLSDQIKKDIKRALTKMKGKSPKHGYVFSSGDGEKPIDRSHVYRILQKCAEEISLAHQFSTQSLRKTYGYHYLKQGGDIHKLRKRLGRRSCEDTKKYVEYDISFSEERFYL